MTTPNLAAEQADRKRIERLYREPVDTATR
jgi:hypothetical protein